MSPNELSLCLLMAIMSMAICMSIIPAMLRYAPYLGMNDSPCDRKVHNSAIPRSGGIGIVLGILIPLLLWLETSAFSTSLIIGCSILLFFGAWDDVRNIRPAYKFIGQLLAAVSVVYYGGVYVHHFPFIGIESIPDYIGKPLTVVAIVGMINALNLSDGLDGLAGGEALISLVAIAYLAFYFNSALILTIAAVAIGGIFGFLRFNSHPARIFMGDAGSQTLGFLLAVLAVYLTQQVNPLVSPGVALLLLGLPVIDSLVVFYIRAKRGDSLVVATKDHLHHRLLALGFYHYESVMVIYSIHIILVVSAILFPYESDFLLISLYLTICALTFSALVFAERKNYKVHGKNVKSRSFLSSVLKKYKNLRVLPYRCLKACMSLFIVSSAVMTYHVPRDLAALSLVLFLSLCIIIFLRSAGDGYYRLLMFVTIGASVYLLSSYPPPWLLAQVSLAYIFFISITVLSFVTIRVTLKDKFTITPLDYLVVIFVIIVGAAHGIDISTSSMIWMAIQIIILFYACELIIQNMKSQLNSFTAIVALSLSIMVFRGFL